MKVAENGTMLTDFESAVHKAKNTCFGPNCKSAGCAFHFTQGIKKDVVRQKLKNKKQNNPVLQAEIRSLMMLMYIPEKDIPKVFLMLKQKLSESQSKAVKLCPRLETYYIFGTVTKAGVQKPPKFPPAMWSVHARVLAGDPTTTNFLEGHHRGLDFKITRNHPDFFHFGRAIAQDIASVDMERELLLT